MKEKNRKNDRTIFIITVFISFVAILIYNFFTPFMSDDLLIDTSRYKNFGDIIKDSFDFYMNANGRLILQSILRVCSLFPKPLFNILNSACFVLLMLLIYWNITGGQKYNSILYIIINLFVWNFSVEFAQTVLWFSGACNYLWGTTIILGLVTCYRKLSEGQTPEKNKILRCIGLFIWGIFAGWCNENTSGGGLLIVLAFTLLYFLQHKKILPYMVCTITGMMTGLLLMVCAPGNTIRKSYMQADETHTGILAYVGRFLKINKNINRFMMLYIAIIIILMVYFIYKKRKLKEFIPVFIFGMTSLACSYVLVFTPEPMPRAYFGANIFMLIACMEVISKISKEDEIWYSLKNGLAIAGMVWMFFSYLENGANLARILRSVNERENYIQEQVAQGNYDLTLPMISDQFITEYSFAYDSDLSYNPDYYINQVFLIKYGLNSIEAVEAEEWEP